MTFKYYNTTKEVLSLFVTAFIEPILYHPLIMFFSLKGYFSFITSRELAWGTMTRQGFEKEEDKKDKGGNKNDGNNTGGNNNKETKRNLFDKIKNKKDSGDFEPIKT